MKILVTSFDPFGGEAVNPAFEAVKQLPNTIAGAEIIKLELPTAFKRSAQVLEQAIKEQMPNAVLCVGQAGGRAKMTVEKVAINLGEARIPDNDDDQPIDEPLIEGGETAYFSTLPIKAMVWQMNQGGIPAGISYSAGTYVCNSIMYHALHLAQKELQGLRAGFIHVPFAPEQVVDKTLATPSMSLNDITKGLELSIEAMVKYKNDEEAELEKVSLGTTH